MASPEPLADWLDTSLTDELLASVDLGGPYSAEENNLLFSLFNDNGGTGASSFNSLDDDMLEDIDDKKVVLASAAAARLRGAQGGLKHAFSTGDLQALTPSSPSPDAGNTLNTATSLESVPEGSTFDPGAIPAVTSNPTSGTQPLPNLNNLSTDELEAELSRRKNCAVKSESSESASTAPVTAPVPPPGVVPGGYIPAGAMHPGGFAGAYIAPTAAAFGRGGGLVAPAGMVPAAMGPMGAIPAGMIPAAAMGPMQPAIPCQQGMPKMAPGAFYVQDGNFMMPGMPGQQDALRSAAQQASNTMPMAMPVPVAGMPSMPQQAFMSQPPTAMPCSGPFAGAPCPTAATAAAAADSPVRGLRKSQSTPTLSSLPGTSVAQTLSPAGELAGAGDAQRIGRLTAEERRQKVLRYRQKRHERKFEKRVTYQCRKTLADSRPRVRGRFARNDDSNAVMPHQTKKALAAQKEAEDQEAGIEDMLDVQMDAQCEGGIPKVEQDDCRTSLDLLKAH
ncbi:unnamed protein product [Ostreobium quekettii]|uniref:CCT domain-containing protein n=1 Tax=Ostreobium quekettii TaxID=121088 RepID=A0A8S1IWT6_9CHLO|nr:unnamed protein product [Ostreobium quekettii]